MLLQQSIEHVSVLYTCNTYFVMHVIYKGASGQCSHTIQVYSSLCMVLLGNKGILRSGAMVLRFTHSLLQFFL